jgi:hypothetical protein
MMYSKQGIRMVQRGTIPPKRRNRYQNVDFRKLLLNYVSVLVISLDSYLRSDPLGKCVTVFYLLFTGTYTSAPLCRCVSVCGCEHVTLHSVVWLLQIQREVSTVQSPSHGFHREPLHLPTAIHYDPRWTLK